MATLSVLVAVLDRAAAQHGVVSRAQVLGLGGTPSLIRSQLRSGRWVAVYPGVYKVRGAPGGWHQRVMAAVLVCGEGAVASHDTAVAVLDLDGARRRNTVEVSVPRPRKVEERVGIRVHRSRLLCPEHTTAVAGIPVTNPPVTLLDYASRRSAYQLDIALDSARRRRIMSLDDVTTLLDGHGRGHPGAAVLRAAVEARDPSGPIPDSVLESFYRHVMAPRQIPRPAFHHEVHEGGRFVAEVDFAYPAFKIAIQLDGYRYHSGRRAWRKQSRQLNRLQLMEWIVLGFDSIDLEEDLEETCADITRALVQRSTSRPAQP